MSPGDVNEAGEASPIEKKPYIQSVSLGDMKLRPQNLANEADFKDPQKAEKTQ